MTDESRQAFSGLSPAAWISIGVAAVLGAGLRLFRLDRQVLTGDELHGLNGALSRAPGEILTEWTYFGADYSIPLTFLTRMAMDAGFALDETLLRLPSLVAGLVAICVLPAVWARPVGNRSAALFAWLIAISPLLVLYGRIARSYAPALLVAWVAIAAFERAWRARSRIGGATYAICAALAVYLHLGTAPLVLTPIAWAGGALVLARGEDSGRAGWLHLAGLSIATAIGLAILLGPPVRSLLALPGLDQPGNLPNLDTWLDVARLQTGTAHVAVSLIIAAAAVRGFVLLARRDAGLATLFALLGATHVLALLVVRPYLLESAVVLNRYVLFLLPGGLLLAAHGLANLPEAVQSRLRLPAWGTGAVAVVLLFLAGPLLDPGFRTSVFAHSNPSVLFIRPPDAMPPGLVPQFYLGLASGEAGNPLASLDEGLLEYPAANVATHAFDAYQRIHGRGLVLGSINQLHADDRLALRTLSAADPGAFQRTGVRYVVVHLNLQSEEGAVVTQEFHHRKRLEDARALWSVLRRAGTRMAERLESEWGDPVYSDQQIRVWDVQALGISPAVPSGLSTEPVDGESPGLSSEASGG